MEGRKKVFFRKIFDLNPSVITPKKLRMFSENLDIVAIFTYIDLKNLPFGYLQQLKQIGISSIYFLLSKEEINQFESKKIVIDDYCDPANVIDYLRSSDNGIMIQVIDSEQAQSDEEKLHFYLASSKDNNLLTLFFCKEMISGMSQCLVSEAPMIQVTSFLNLFEWERRVISIPFQYSEPSQDELELLSREQTPVFCFKLDFFDLPYYQWLFRIFTGLLYLTARYKDEINTPGMLNQVNELVKEYENNIQYLENEEKLFEKLHYQVQVKNNCSIEDDYKKCAVRREEYLKKFAAIIKKLILLYRKNNSPKIIKNDKLYLYK